MTMAEEALLNLACKYNGRLNIIEKDGEKRLTLTFDNPEDKKKIGE